MTENDKEVYQKGVALLEEWEDVNYCEHYFKFKDEWITDKEVVDFLNEQQNTINTYKEGNKTLKATLDIVMEENEQLKQFIKELTTKGTGRIDLASGYSYNVSAVLTGYRGDVE